MWIQYLFVFLAFLVDGLLSTLFPPTITFQSMSFVSCFGFVALVLTIRKMDRLDAILLSVFSGMFYDFFFTETFLVYTILFPLLCLVVKSWAKHIGDSLFENIVICLSAIFALEALVYGYMRILEFTQIGFTLWVKNRMFLTLIINTILILILHFFTLLKDERIRSKELQVQKEEKLFLYKNKKR